MDWITDSLLFALAAEKFSEAIKFIGDLDGNGKQNLILVLTVAAAFFTHRGTVKQNRKTRSLEFNEKLISDETLTKAFKLIRDLPSDYDRRCDYLKQILEMEDEKALLTYFLNTYEALALGVEEGVYDNRLLEKAQRTLLIRNFNHVWPCIENRRCTMPTAYVSFEKLVKKWEKNRKRDVRVATAKQYRQHAVIWLALTAIAFLPVIVASAMQ